MTSPEAGTAPQDAAVDEFDPALTGTAHGRTYVAITAELKRLVDMVPGSLLNQGAMELCREADEHFLPANVGALPAVWVDRLEVLGTADLEADPPLKVPWAAVTVVTVLPGVTIEDATDVAAGFESEMFRHYTVHILTPEEIRSFQEQAGQPD